MRVGTLNESARTMILGIEIGGTKLQLGVSDGRSSDLLELRRVNVDRDRGAQGILEQIESVATDLLQEHRVASLGIGFGGPVDRTTQSVIKSHQVDGWENFALGDWCRARLGLPLALGNDCNVAALAEATVGAGQGLSRVFYVTVGTGIGGGFVVDGRIDGQERPAVAEIGHLRPGTSARDGGDTVESLSSGLGMETRLRQQISESRGDDLPEIQDLLSRSRDGPEQLTAKEIAKAAQAGNRLAQETLDTAIGVLGWAIAQVVTLTAPHRIVVGGGVSLMGEPFFERLRREVTQYSFAPLSNHFDIVPAALGELSVVHGAIQLAALSDDTNHASAARP